ncbi:MAG TPA: DUF899 domain-containing protein [Pseudonocardiaceae bacterium]
MSLPEVVARDEWLAARRQLLLREKELTRQRDVLNADRRRLPMVRIEKDYVFEGPDGKAGLLDLFGDSRQLIVYHAMFDPSWDAACPSCSAGMDESSPAVIAHLKARATSYVRVARAPYPKIAAYQAGRGWTFPWYSSYDSDFNYDFQVTLDASATPIEYNYRPADALVQDGATELPGFSCFLRDGDAVFHTYSAYARGTEPHNGTYPLLDLTALGRQEAWEEPKGRADKTC